LREIIFDTETTGLDKNTDRVIEIGAIEMINRFPTGRTFHVYINPQGKQIHKDAQAVHGISMQDLADKPIFDAIIDDFIDFIDDAKLIAHNASFDVQFLNAEFARCDVALITNDRVVDTLQLARRKHPMGPNSLDALCKRYRIDNSNRTLHGALLDAQLLTQVYLELIGARQSMLGLDVQETVNETETKSDTHVVIKQRPQKLPTRLNENEQQAHLELVKKLGDQAIWRRILND
jgi:DNA polymerase III subunit epsilon